MTRRREIARVVALGRRGLDTCSVLAIRWEGGWVTLYPHGIDELAVDLPPTQWATLVALPSKAA